MALHCFELTGKGKCDEALETEAFLMGNFKQAGKNYRLYSMMWAASALNSRGGDSAGTYAKWLISECVGSQENGKWKDPMGDTLATIFVTNAFAGLE